VPRHDIIVVGASAGGIEGLTNLVHRLPPNFAASIFVVLHLPAGRSSVLPTILNRAGFLVALFATDNAVIEYGHIYVAPPDHHLLVEYQHVHVTSGSKENHHRPAIDPLFRSAALAYGSRVVGVILSGALNDGTAGLLSVKQCGGVAIVQDPDEAAFPDMPRSALAHVEVDYTLPVSRIGPLLIHLVDDEQMKAD